MKTHRTHKRPTQAMRRRRPTITAFRQPTIAPAAPQRPQTKYRPPTAHDFLAICLYPGMGDHHTAA